MACLYLLRGGLLLLALFVSPAFSAPKPTVPVAPPVVYSTPLAVVPGTNVDVTWFGTTLGEPVGLWTSFPATVTPLPAGGGKKTGQAKYRITVPADVPPCIGAIRLMTTAGASSLRMLLVDDLPSVMRQGGNTRPGQAQAVQAGVAIDGACEPLVTDYYKLSARKGQRVSVEVVAQRMGSKMDPMIRLLDAAGHELVYCDDSPGAASDCRFAYTFATGGDFFIEIRDVNYEGGNEYRYRLRIGDFPIVTSVWPAGGQRGDVGKFTLQGDGAGRLAPISTTLPGDMARTWLDARFPDGLGSALVPIWCADLPEVPTNEPNNTPLAATRLTVPSVTNGRFDKPDSKAYFELTAKKGERFSVVGLSRTIGSDGSLSLQLLNSDGTKLLESKSDGPDDASLDVTIPADGTYQIRAAPLVAPSGQTLVYRLEVRPVRPGFALSVETEALNATPGATIPLKVTAVRRDYTGPIMISLEGDGREFELTENVIPAGKTEIDVQIKVPADLVTPVPIHLSAKGKATIGDVELSERVSTMPALKKLFPRIPYPPPELDGLIGLGVRP